MPENPLRVGHGMCFVPGSGFLRVRPAEHRISYSRSVLNQCRLGISFSDVTLRQKLHLFRR